MVKVQLPDVLVPPQEVNSGESGGGAKRTKLCCIHNHISLKKFY
jgi:hypothetical protein